MFNIYRSLKVIEESLKESLNLFQLSKNIYADVKRTSKIKNDDYDFDVFDEINVFNKLEGENINEEEIIDFQSNLYKVDIILNNLSKSLNEQRNIVFEKYMLELKTLSDEIHATSSVQLFVKHWNRKLSDNYQLSEYPEMFNKCLLKIPIDHREKIIPILSNIKSMPNNYVDKPVLQEINKNSVYDMNVTEDYSVSESIKKSLPKSKEYYNRGKSGDKGMSVLDYTICDDANIKITSSIDLINVSNDTSLQPLSTCRQFSLIEEENSIYIKDTSYLEDQLNDSTSFYDDVLNQQICDQSVSFDDDNDEDNNYDYKEVDGKRVYGSNYPSFMNDTARIPPIEHIHPDETYDPYYRDFHDSIEMSTFSIHEDSKRFRDDDEEEECMNYEEEECVNNGLEHDSLEDAIVNEMSFTRFELNSSDFADFSFNKTRIRSDNDDDKTKDEDMPKDKSQFLPDNL